jgi:5-methylcytosine-specific restriction endonuclease McrA
VLSGSSLTEPARLAVTLFSTAVEAATATEVTPAASAGQGRETHARGATDTGGGLDEPAGGHAAHAPAPRRSDGGRVLVLNASYEPLNVCSVRRAVVLVLKDKAELVEKSERAVRSESVTLPHPVVIRLVSYVRVPRDKHRRRITRRAVFARDSWTCQYCGTTAHLTVDHVIPRSRGGGSEWENIVTSCAPCNRRKGNRTPVETGMHPHRSPRAPGPTIFITVAAPVIPAAWRQYLI